MTDRPATEKGEIEITPEMIEAGVDAFVGYDSRFEGPHEIVVEIFEAMITVQSSPEEQILGPIRKEPESESAKERR